jgi:AcrR family transcriptional regulator
MATTGTGRRGRPPKAEAGDTKGALLQAALKLFAEKGYAGTSVRAIAREVGLSESVMYAHFAGKRAIFDAVLERLGPASTLPLLGSVDPALIDSDPPAFVRALVAAIVEAWAAPDSRQLISLMVRDGLVHDPALVAGILEAVERVAGLFAHWIEDGRIAPETGAPQDLAYALISPVAQARLLWQHGGSTPEDLAVARERGRRHAEFFVRAVFRR